jgi:ABC-2 type transport system ATP-binding protein
MAPVIQVAGLHKAYGDFEAVRGIDFDVSEGEVFGLLGPNGAGKTTTVEILEGLRPRSKGRVEVLGFDPEVSKRSLKDRIGVCLQATNLPDKLRVHEALDWFAAFYSRKADCNKLLQRLQLWEKRNEFYSKLSGGQKQRVALALALVNDPNLVFLDEPTTGLDPQVRLEIHTLIEELKAAKRTILLTTHYIEEADHLCDRVAIVDQGRVIAMGTPDELRRGSAGMTSIQVKLAHPAPDLRQLDGVSDVSEVDGGYVLHSARPPQTIVALVKHLEGSGNELLGLEMASPTLEDAFIELTGRRLRD